MIEIENKTQHKLDDEYTPLPKLELFFFFSMSLDPYRTKFILRIFVFFLFFFFNELPFFIFVFFW